MIIPRVPEKKKTHAFGMKACISTLFNIEVTIPRDPEESL